MISTARTSSPARRALAAALVVAIGLLGPLEVHAAPAASGAVQGPALPSVEDEPGDARLPDVEAEVGAEPESAPSETATPEAEPAQVEPPPPEPPPPTMQEPERIRVAVGLSSELDGNKQEKALLDQLEGTVQASEAPRVDVRRLRVGAAEPREICREARDDLVITIGYVPAQDDPVLLTYDCRIDQELGTRRSTAAEDPEFVGVLWSEHADRVANGARERRRARVSPKVRTGLIAGAAVAVIGVAVGLLIAGAVQRDSVVLVVSP